MNFKKFTLAVLGIGLSASAMAQTPVKKTKTIIFDFSETWCYPCGEHGVDVGDSLEANLERGDKGYLVSVKTTSLPAAINASGGKDLFSNFSLTDVPAFVINNGKVTDAITGSNAADVSRIMTKTDLFNAVDAVAGIAADAAISGTTLTVHTTAEFWDTTSENIIWPYCLQKTR